MCYFYHPRMQKGNVLLLYVCLWVCVSVCLDLATSVLPPAYAGKEMFSYCLSVCLSVCTVYDFWMPWPGNFIFWNGGISWPHLGQVWASMSLDQGQGHFGKRAILSVWHQIVLVWPTYGINMEPRSRSFLTQIGSISTSITKGAERHSYSQRCLRSTGKYWNS